MDLILGVTLSRLWEVYFPPDSKTKHWTFKGLIIDRRKDGGAENLSLFYLCI